MLVVLNLTMPPILLLFLPAALVGNYTLPAPPASEVAAFSPGGAPLPTWVLNGTLYVLQGGEPAVAVYVPTFTSSNGVYKVGIVRGPFVAQAPPGVMVVEARPQPAGVAVNKTGLYLYFDTGATIAYQAFTIQPTPTTSPPTQTTMISPPPATTSAPPRVTATTTPIITTTSMPNPSTDKSVTSVVSRGPSSTSMPTPWLLVVVLSAVITMLVIAIKFRKR